MTPYWGMSLLEGCPLNGGSIEDLLHCIPGNGATCLENSMGFITHKYMTYMYMHHTNYIHVRASWACTCITQTTYMCEHHEHVHVSHKLHTCASIMSMYMYHTNYTGTSIMSMYMYHTNYTGTSMHHHKLHMCEHVSHHKLHRCERVSHKLIYGTHAMSNMVFDMA